MKNTHRLLIGTSIACFCVIHSGHAEDSHEHDSEHTVETRQLESHEHGVSTLKIAIEGQNEQMELESPANDIVGFEHAPENNKQKADSDFDAELDQDLDSDKNIKKSDVTK